MPLKIHDSAAAKRPFGSLGGTYIRESRMNL